MSGFQPALSIYDAIGRIQSNEYLLPAFQREFEWDVDRITRLFDSLMKGYPISSMLFWKVKDNTKASFKFYQFLDKYIELHHIHNDSIDAVRLKDFHAVLDGQQRLTSLFLGLCGSYAYKEYRKSYAYSESSYPTRHLYLNLTRDQDVETEEEFYDFQFLPKSETSEKDLFTGTDGVIWFKASRIISLHNDDKYTLDDFIEDSNFDRKNKEILRRFDRLIFNKPTINFYEEDEQKADKAVNIFVRINSGGIGLNFSDILMAIAVANWQKEDARTEIHNLVDLIKSKGFSVTKDFVLKSFLFLFHKDVRFQIHNFDNDFMKKIESEWPKIRDSIASLFDTLRTFGLNDYNLTSNNATLPILFYIYYKNIWKNFSAKTSAKAEREQMKKWLFTVLLRKTFGGQTDSVLSQARKAFAEDILKIDLSNLVAFPGHEINKEIKKYSDVTDDIIDELLLTQKDSQYSFPILSMLYPNLDYKNNDFHQDHTHPASRYDEIDDEAKKLVDWEIYNSIINLQMLDANENMSKNDLPLEDWVNQETKGRDRARFLDSHLIPNVSLKKKDIVKYFEDRREMLRTRMRLILS